ncbi:hypothetical protein FGO68_gene12298 [Halteria grandinella]|uniref:Uncharacterized protein n=1 Tax=Halteria grandinella TaxID=5974 RepID=A0A8J8NXQ9_HALGN|nr:hypothetical protein FGO68_gene12298 [Halteria grandinella]
MRAISLWNSIQDYWNLGTSTTGVGSLVCLIRYVASQGSISSSLANYIPLISFFLSIIISSALSLTSGAQVSSVYWTQ